MRVTTETVVETGHLLMNHGVVLDGVLELTFLLRIRQFAVLQQIGHFEEVALLGQLLDRDNRDTAVRPCRHR
jgi:hypothetical protein